MRCSVGVALLALAACTARDALEPLVDPAAGDTLAIAVDVEPRTVRLLDPVRVTIDLWSAADVDADCDPAVPEGFTGEIERSSRPWQDGTLERFVLHLRPTAVGEVEVPAFEARIGETVAATEPVTIEVESALAAAPDELADPEAVEAPASLFPPRAPIWPWLAGAGAIVLAVLLAVFLRRRPRHVPAAVALPAHVRARRALARLRSAMPTTEAEVEAFYVAVSDVLRAYLEERFGLHAPERTTEEFLPEVERSGLLDATQRTELQRFLSQCDLVKFAAAHPTEDVHERTLAAAESLVEQTAADRMEGAA